MKKYLLVINLIITSLPTLHAQKEGSIKGIVKDTSANQPLADATITVLLAKDSSLVSFSRTNSNGFFSIRNMDKGDYRLLITHVGYRNLNKLFSVTNALADIDFGTLFISNKSVLLDEVTITQEKPPVVIRNDTIEFNASSFKTKPNALVEDLLKKLPGVQVDKDGKIKSNGEEVKKILVDGKEFFGSDPKMATKNLPADAVDKVQVFDRKSDQSRFTGFDDGNSEKTINLTIKQDRKNGVFGKAAAGAGDKGRYDGNFNVNSFSGERQVSAIGMANNTNKQGFSFLDILNFSGGLPGAGGRGGGSIQIDGGSGGLPVQGLGNNNEGITTTQSGGLNYNNTWQKKMDFMSSYFFNHLQTDKTQRVNQQWLLPGNNFNTVKDNNSNSTNENHRANFTSDYKIDSSNSIRVSSFINWQQSQNYANSKYSSVSTSGNPLNDGYTNSYLSGNGYSWNNNALLRHRFAKKGRTFSANLSLNVNDNKSNGGLQSQNNYYLPDGSLQHSDTLNQQYNQNNNSNSFGTVLSYTEPLSKKSLLEFNYNFNTTHSVSAKNTFDLDKTNGKYSIVNDSLTNKFSNNYYYYRPGINWRYQQKNKYSFAFGAALQRSLLKSNFHEPGTDSSIGRSFTNFLPVANFQYNINSFRNFKLLYNTMTRQPSVTQLQPLTDNSDPLNIKIGNPGLKQEYYHRLQADYISFDPYQHTSFFAAMTASLTQNKIVNADQLGAQGQRITQPVNANGAYNFDIYTSWGFPVKKIKSKLNLNSSVSRNHDISFVNAQNNNISSWNATEEIRLSYGYKELFDFSTGAEIIYNSVRYSLQGQQNIQYWNQHYTAEVNFYFSKGFSFASDVDYTTRSGLSQGYDVSAVLWNAGIAKQVFKNKKGEFRLQVYDILSQNIGISRNSNQNYIEDVSYNVLKRFFQLTFTYNISRFAGNNIAAPGRRNDIQVIRNGKGM